MTTLNYRQDIDGLRFLAIMPVVLYHLNPSLMPSGYIGVDVFLVISGYLISNIIISATAEGSFSLQQFYVRRIKRILPLCYVVIFTTLIAGWVLSFPATYRMEANSAISALFFLANVRFAITTDYFNPSQDAPLLHLWSLSLEEQFYFILPLLCLFLVRIKRQDSMLILSIGLLLLSLLLSQYMIGIDKYKALAYFLLPTRMAGLLVGVIVALLVQKQYRLTGNRYGILGMILLLGSAVFIDKAWFPGVISLLPCLATALLILSAPDALVNRLLATRPLVFVGKISFSIYMWHWPMLVFARRVMGPDDPFNWITGSLFLLCLLLVASLSYVFIENKFRHWKITDNRVLGGYLVLPMLVLTLTNLGIARTNGLPLRFGLTDTMTRTETLSCYNSLLRDTCYLSRDQQANNKLLLIGDSHAGSMSHFFKDISAAYNISTLDASAGGCAFYSDTFYSYNCENVKNKIRVNLANQRISTIAIGKRYDQMEPENVNKVIDFGLKLRDQGYRVIFIDQVPLLASRYQDNKFMQHYIQDDVPTQMTDMDMSYKKYRPLLQQRLLGEANIMLLTLDAFFQNGDKYIVLDENQYPLYYDDDHLSAYGSEWLAKQYLSKMAGQDDLKAFINAEDRVADNVASVNVQ